MTSSRCSGTGPRKVPPARERKPDLILPDWPEHVRFAGEIFKQPRARK